MLYFFFFFFQAEDGIRDADVTGVQTCALPISDDGAVHAARVDDGPDVDHRDWGGAGLSPAGGDRVHHRHHAPLRRSVGRPHSLSEDHPMRTSLRIAVFTAA